MSQDDRAKMLRAKTIYANMLMQQDALNKGIIGRVNFQGSSSDLTETVTSAPSLFTPIELNNILLNNGVVLPSLSAYTEIVLTVPTSPTLSGAASSTSVVLSWNVPLNGGSAITGYKLTRITGGTTPTSVTTTTTLTTANITALTNGTTYTFSVIAVNAVGDSVASSSISLIPGTVPASPTLSGAVASRSVVLSWNVPSNGGLAITGYRVSSINGNVSTTSTTTTIKGLTNGTPYIFTVVAINSIGDSLPSASISATPVIIWTAAMSAGSRQWKGIASSDDGLNVVAIASNSFIFVSANSGETWTQRASSRDWTCVASSSDGKNLAVGLNGGYIHTSTDFGVTWIEQIGSGSFNWVSLVSSSDGSKLTACTDPNPSNLNGYIYTSTDFGVTWIRKDSAGRRNNWGPLASSRDGNILYAATQRIYKSVNSGDWGQIPENSVDSNPYGFNLFANWATIVTFSNGTKAIASSQNTVITENSGTSWRVQENPAGVGTTITWNSMSANSDGTALIATTSTSGGSVYISTDTGVSWIKQTNFNTNGTISNGSLSWNKVALSSNGQILFAAAMNGYIYIT